MSFEFWKMQACGNDFVIIDARKTLFELSATFIKKLADRHFGIGFDSLLVLAPAKTPDAAALYRVFNADGSEAGQCGNGARCVAEFLFAESKQSQKNFILETIDQSIALEIVSKGMTRCALAIPNFNPALLPIKLEATVEKDFPAYSLQCNDNTITFYGVSLGNPHAVIFVDNLQEAPVKEIGAFFNKHEAFPQGINVSFVEPQDDHTIKVRVFERGVGETLACGSGACASALLCIMLGKATNPVQVFLPGGMVQVDWAGKNKPVSLIGPAKFVFTGTWAGF